MAFRIARALDKLRSQINDMYPRRSKVSDGWIGDQVHASRRSDHNPNSAGVVQAFDITHDVTHGPDTWKLAELLRQRRDSRIKYVISNGRMFSSVVQPWEWRPYTGANKHAHHVHISVNDDPRAYDDASPWQLGAATETTKTPVPQPAPPTAPATESKGTTMDLSTIFQLFGAKTQIQQAINKGLPIWQALQTGNLRALIPLLADIGASYFPKVEGKIKIVTAAAEALFDEHGTSWVQASLNKLNEAGVIDEIKSLVVDGHMGPLTKAAVEAFQKQHQPDAGPVDGWPGAKTKAAIAAAIATHVEVEAQ